MYENQPWDVGEREYNRLWNVMRMSPEEARRVLSVLKVAARTRRPGPSAFTNPKDRAKENG